MGNRIIAMVAVVGVLALAAVGVYLYRQQHGPAPSAEDGVATGEPAKPAQPGPQDNESPAVAPPSGPAAVPSFDVVRIEPNGEGVIAGRAEPGWTVSVESGDSTVAETTSDEEGAWTIVLAEPLASGAHSLSLRAISPDGTRALTAQQSVQVAVGEAAAPGEQEVAATEAPKPDEEVKPDQQAEASAGLESQPQPVVPDEQDGPRERPKPPVRIGKLEYQDTADGGGKISVSGVGEPKAQVYLFFDQQPFGQVVIGDDGSWVFEIEKKLEAGEHTIRADTYDAKTGVVAGRASVRLGREPEAAEPETATQEPAAPKPPAEPAVAEAEQPSGQPEPVYPAGTPEAEASATTPSTSVAVAEPSDLSSQPQPVYPEEIAEPEAPSSGPSTSVAASEPTPSSPIPEPVYPDGPPAKDMSAPEPSMSVAAAEPLDLSSQPQPVVPEEAAQEPEPAQPEVAEEAPAASEPETPAPAPSTPAVTAERPSEAEPARPETPPVVFKSVDYQDIGDESGTVSLFGTGEPGARILLFFDEEPLGRVVIGDDGTWTFRAPKRLAAGNHVFRADRIEEGTGTVIGRASIGVARLEKPKAPPEEEQVAAAPMPSAPAAEASPEKEPGAVETPSEPDEQMAAVDETKPAMEAGRRAHRPKVYIVRRGDTLWEIAEAYYGGGWHYKAIARENRGKIRNPHWIYPEQKFRIPAR